MTRRPRSTVAQDADAADWIVRLQGDDLDEAQLLAFDAWLGAADGAAAYDRTVRTWQEFERCAPAVQAGLQKRYSPPRLRHLYAAAGAMAAAAAIAIIVIPTMKVVPAVETYATAKGEHRSIDLADGSRIDLDAGTRLTVALHRDRRDVAMDQGQAVFDVAADAKRPFLVVAGDRTVRVVGTQFDLRRRAGRLSVTVTRGSVEVVPNGKGSGRAFRLHPGQRFDHTEGAATERISAAAPDQALGWRTGKLIYRDQPLSDVIADLNAQFRTPVRIDNARLADTPISGVLIVDDEDAVLRRLALLVSARTVRSDRGVLLQRNETSGR